MLCAARGGGKYQLGRLDETRFQRLWCTYTNVDGLHGVDDCRPHEDYDDDTEAKQFKEEEVKATQSVATRRWESDER